MKGTPDVCQASEAYAATARRFCELLAELMPKFFFVLTAITIISERKPLDQIAESLKQFDFIDLEELEKKGLELRALALEFSKSSERFASLVALHIPPVHGQN